MRENKKENRIKKEKWEKERKHEIKTKSQEREKDEQKGIENNRTEK